MSIGHTSQIVTNGLVLCLDAATSKSYGPTLVEVLVVAGGGGGGGWGGGGGGGGVIYNPSFAVSPGTAYTVTVGGGGTAGTSAYSGGGNGANSVFSSLTAIGGGGGGWWPSGAGATGGSGGGGSGTGTTGAGTNGQGSDGGNAPGTTQSTPYLGHGGGGGAGGAGQGGMTNTTGGAGGVGLQYIISGTSTWYAGGGGGHSPGANSSAVAAGGTGGGGAGGNYYSNLPAYNGTTNTGGGGGGNYGDASRGIGGGGSGIVIIRYPGLQKATGGTVTTNGGYTTHTFTTLGTFTPGGNATWTDLSGNSMTATLVGSPTYSTTSGGYLTFDGSTHYGTLTSGSNFTFGTGDFTLEAWYYPNVSYATGNGYILDLGANGTRLQLYYNQIFLTLQSQVLSCGGTAGQGVTSGSWYHVIGTRIGSAVTLYLNGVSIGSGTSSASLSDSGGTIGNYGGGGGYKFNGRLAVIKVYKNRGLTAAEAAQNFNALRGRFGI